ncbi:hypothetical protein KP001_07885 [Geomonas subterranea]|uniref:Uncharacterized protein n=1 Tax=Geomonas subterranea TaxID=2847989 RepID=A0ABX8LK71_9BACT|nr:hypothetical protein [Geomonas subterranea]QXE92433.1 hypothetical protein KP001_07885 [Geomonas subterranea]QXM09468.1 hypothetical protein KP002_21385 [Geomonas subterranea]
MKSKYSVAVLSLLCASLVTPVWSATTKPLSINELAAKPDTHIGKVAVVGRVAAVTPGKGFTLIDSANCSTCTTDCLTDKSTKKIPFLWGGASPALKDVVVVQGTLSKTAKGFTVIADNLKKQ